MTCLRFWVGDMHVDGFRFDLASILGRDRNGQRAGRAAGDREHRRGRRAGRHQADRRAVGRRRAVPGGRVPVRPALERVERPVPRRRAAVLARRRRASPAALATRAVRQSSDLYQWSGRLPRHSVNFVTCHDGFTLGTWSATTSKHNEANGEGNRDGCDDNYSWNCGVEGDDRRPRGAGACAGGRRRT